MTAQMEASVSHETWPRALSLMGSPSKEDRDAISLSAWASSTHVLMQDEFPEQPTSSLSLASGMLGAQGENLGLGVKN